MQPTIPHEQLLPPGVIKGALDKAFAAPGADAETDQSEAFSPRETGETHVVNVAKDQLRAFVERIERLEEEKKTVADDIKDVYGEAKGFGFDTKQLKRVIALRKKDEGERMEEEAILETYLAALGMLAG